MKKRNFMSITLVIAFTAVLFVHCKKEDSTTLTPTPTPTPSTSNPAKAATENASIEAAFSDAFKQVDKFAKDNGKGINSCPTVTITPFDQTYPKDLEIDYGTSCTGNDGVIRSGKIKAHLTKSYIDSGSVATVTFDNYYVNSRKITGTEIITNKGKNNAGHHVFEADVQNGTLYSPDGVTTYNSIQQREWIEGDGTLLDPTDDVYLNTGTANGTTTDGVNYTLVITTPLRVALSCAWVESGKFEMTEPNIPVITLDYGNTGCDNDAVVTCAGYTFNIEMP